MIFYVSFLFLSVFRSSVTITANVPQLGEGGDFHHKPAGRQAGVEAENQTLINHKCVCGALNRHFCQTRVGCCILMYPVVLS